MSALNKPVLAIIILLSHQNAGACGQDSTDTRGKKVEIGNITTIAIGKDSRACTRIGGNGIYQSVSSNVKTDNINVIFDNSLSKKRLSSPFKPCD